MCGIAGMVRFDERPVDRHALEGACRALRHRGPDDAGVWVSEVGRGAIGLAATRLAVLDPSLAGHQPMSRGDGRYWVVHNGEIYNFRKLRTELVGLGERFSTQTDTEVLAAACIRWGPKSLDRFNGMWAFAFYDVHEGTGFVARDRFGVKPLLWTADGRRFAFASELGPLRQLVDCEETIDRQALLEHLVFGYMGGNKTIYQAIQKLEPAHYLPFSKKGVGPPVRYYRPTIAPPRGKNSDADLCSSSYAKLCGEIRRTLNDAVILRRVSDVPIGAFLSGGLDSTIVVAHLAAASGRPVKTFSVGYAGTTNYDETVFARLAANWFGTDHHELILSERNVLDAIPGILDHLGEPVGDSSIIPCALISRFARDSVTVTLSGDGGDELFGGYWRYMAHDTLRAYQRIPYLIRRFLIEPISARMGSSRTTPGGDRIRQFRKLLRAARDSETAMARHIAWSRILAPEAEGIIHRGLGEPNAVQELERATQLRAESLIEEFDSDDPLNRIMAVDLQNQLPADLLQKVDLASMMSSLEVRTPFLDPSVVESALAIPSAQKIRSGVKKRILIDTYRGWLPDEILDRPKKGFEVPLGEYFRGPLRTLFQDVVTRPAIESFGILSYDAVLGVVSSHLARRGDHADLLFALLSLCWWRRHRRTSRS